MGAEHGITMTISRSARTRAKIDTRSGEIKRRSEHSGRAQEKTNDGRDAKGGKSMLTQGKRALLYSCGLRGEVWYSLPGYLRWATHERIHINE